MFSPQDTSEIQKIVRQVLATEISTKKVNDTPLEAYDCANKKYVDGKSAKIVTGGSSWTLTSSGTQTIAHGLGYTPSFVEFEGFGYGSVTLSWIGTWNPSSQSYVCQVGSNGQAGTSLFAFFVDGSGHETGAVITVNATNIILTWTAYSGGVSGTVNFIFKAQ